MSTDLVSCTAPPHLLDFLPRSLDLQCPLRVPSVDSSLVTKIIHSFPVPSQLPFRLIFLVEHTPLTACRVNSLCLTRLKDTYIRKQRITLPPGLCWPPRGDPVNGNSRKKETWGLFIKKRTKWYPALRSLRITMYSLGQYWCFNLGVKLSTNIGNKK